MEKAEMLIQDIEDFRKANGCSRLVMIWCASTEVFHKPAAVHSSLREFESGLVKNDPEIAPSQIYAYAALKSGVHSPTALRTSHDIPAMLELARDRQIPICGKDFKPARRS